MNNFAAIAVAVIGPASLVNAYSSKIVDCQKFAALWSGNCSGTDTDAVYTGTWHTDGAGATSLTCATNDAEVFARQPDTGTNVTSYTMNARNCITCKEGSKDTEVFIRYQTNNIPKHCYGSSDDASVTQYPTTEKIDVEMLWNPNVYGKTNIADDKVSTAAKTTTLLCETAFSATKAATSSYTETGTFNIGDAVGFAMDNVLIYNSSFKKTAGSGNTYHDALDEFSADMDTCLLSVSSTNQIKYQSISGCLKSPSTTQVPTLCKDVDNDKCTIQPVNYATTGITKTDFPYEKAVGLAKDGHIIVGPYNSDGELWSCDDHDVCNGVFLSDNSYAYAMTYTFPYVVGCWGPGPGQVYAASCTKRSCTGNDSVSGLSFAFASLAATLIAMTQF